MTAVSETRFKLNTGAEIPALGLGMRLLSAPPRMAMLTGP